jgi:hypothetical protein
MREARVLERDVALKQTKLLEISKRFSRARLLLPLSRPSRALSFSLPLSPSCSLAPTQSLTEPLQ